MKGDEGERGDEKKKREKKSGQKWPLKRDRTRNGEQGRGARLELQVKGEGGRKRRGGDGNRNKE